MRLSDPTPEEKRIEEAYRFVQTTDEELFEAVVHLGSLVVLATADTPLGARVESCAMGLVARALQSR